MIISYRRLETFFNEAITIGPFSIRQEPNVARWGYHRFISKDGVSLNLREGSDRPLLNQWITDETGVDTTNLFNGYDDTLEIIDLLWNIYNNRIQTNNGRILKSAVKEIQRRSQKYRGLIYGNILLSQLTDAGWVIGGLRTLKEIFDHTTNKVHYFLVGSTYSIDGSYSNCPIGSTPLDFGYIKEGNDYFSPEENMVEYEGVTYRASVMRACSDCGSIVPKGKLHAGLCPVCLNIDPALIVIRGYNERAPNFMDYKLGKYSKSLYSNPLYFGIELEYEVNNMEQGLLDTARLLGKHAIFKRDGSINEGFEIVTTPATFDKQVESMKPFFDKFPTNLSGDANCGMHIHISRNALNYLTQGKLVEFMNRADNKLFIEKMAGRENNSYCRQENGRTISFPFTNGSGQRYNTLNINNEHTLEFRIFATPESWDDFIPRLEFVDALTAYCSPCQSGALSLKDSTHYKCFEDYIRKNKHSWKNLFNLIFNDEVAHRNIKLEAFKSRSIACA